MRKTSARKSTPAKRITPPTLLERFAGVLGGYLDRDPATNIVDAILLDHQALKALLKILKDEDAALEKKRVAFSQLQLLLRSHSDAEEKALYSISSHLRDLGGKTEEGYVEHDVALDLLGKIKRPKAGAPTRHWQAQVQVLAELVEHHLEEEEEDLLPKIRRKLDAKTQSKCARLFIRLRKASQPRPRSRSAGVLGKT